MFTILRECSNKRFKMYLQIPTEHFYVKRHMHIFVCTYWHTGKCLVLGTGTIKANKVYPAQKDTEQLTRGVTRAEWVNSENVNAL